MPANTDCPRCGLYVPCERHADANGDMMTPAELAAVAGDTPADHFHDCTRCGQTVITRAAVPICPTCRRLARQPQGEAVRLFEPAPTQIAGQLTL